MNNIIFGIFLSIERKIYYKIKFWIKYYIFLIEIIYIFLKMKMYWKGLLIIIYFVIFFEEEFNDREKYSWRLVMLLINIMFLNIYGWFVELWSGKI